MLTLSAICHFVRITLVIASSPLPSTEHVFSYGDKMKTATAKVGGITSNSRSFKMLNMLLEGVYQVQLSWFFGCPVHSSIVFADFCKDNCSIPSSCSFGISSSFWPICLSILHLLNHFTHVPVDLAVFAFMFFALKLACAKDGWGFPIPGMGEAGAGGVASQTSKGASNSASMSSLLASLILSMNSSVVSSKNSLEELPYFSLWTNMLKLRTSIASYIKLHGHVYSWMILTNQLKITLSTVLLLLYDSLILIG